MQNENKLVNLYNYITICLSVIIILFVITPIWNFFAGEQIEDFGGFPYIFLFLIIIFWLSKRFYKNFSDENEIIIKAHDLCYASLIILIVTIVLCLLSIALSPFDKSGEGVSAVYALIGLFIFFPGFLFLFIIYRVFYPLRLHFKNRKHKTIE